MNEKDLSSELLETLEEELDLLHQVLIQKGSLGADFHPNTNYEFTSIPTYSGDGYKLPDESQLELTILENEYKAELYLETPGTEIKVIEGVYLPDYIGFPVLISGWNTPDIPLFCQIEFLNGTFTMSFFRCTVSINTDEDGNVRDITEPQEIICFQINHEKGHVSEFNHTGSIPFDIEENNDYLEVSIEIIRDIRCFFESESQDADSYTQDV